VPVNNVPATAIPQSLLPQTTKREVTSDVTGMRVHELALQRWFYTNFYVVEGYPVPVVFANPMDVFAEFDRLFQADTSPFSYLQSLVTTDGKRLYEPYPSNARYPLICVKRKTFAFRPTQSYGIHLNRRIAYPTVAGVEDGLKRKDLGNVVGNNRATAWNYSYQVDHYCLRPDTQAIFIEKVVRKFRLGGGQPMTWLQVAYPPPNGFQSCRLLLEGNINNITEDEHPDNVTVYRTSFDLLIEGYSPDINLVTQPTLWQIISSSTTVAPDVLNGAYTYTTTSSGSVDNTYNLRLNPNNPQFNNLPNLPPTP